MIALELVFNCEHCGEPLGTTCKDRPELVYHYEFHSCFGEEVGFVAEVQGHQMMLAEGVELEVKRAKER